MATMFLHSSKKSNYYKSRLASSGMMLTASFTDVWLINEVCYIGCSHSVQDDIVRLPFLINKEIKLKSIVKYVRKVQHSQVLSYLDY